MFVSDEAPLDIGFEVPLARFAALAGSGVYRAEPGEDGHGTAAMHLGGFLDRIAETIIRAGATAG
jgi:hypothetical protein